MCSDTFAVVLDERDHPCEQVPLDPFVQIGRLHAGRAAQHVDPLRFDEAPAALEQPIQVHVRHLDRLQVADAEWRALAALLKVFGGVPASLAAPAERPCRGHGIDNPRLVPVRRPTAAVAELFVAGPRARRSAAQFSDRNDAPETRQVFQDSMERGLVGWISEAHPPSGHP